MLYLLDTGNLDEIARLVDLYPIAGVTTNPTLVAREQRPFADLIRDIRAVIGKKLMLHVQVMGKDAQTMIREAAFLQDIAGQDVIVKIPVTPQGYKAMKALAETGVRITATAVLVPQQALLAAAAGAEFVAPYVNRLDSIQSDGVGVTSEIVKLLALGKFQTKVLAASFKSAYQVHQIALAGAQSVTLPPDVFETLITHPLTDSGVEQFDLDWAQTYGEGSTLLDAKCR